MSKDLNRKTETSLYMDKKTMSELDIIAKANNRTKIGQIRYWIKESLKELKA